MTTRWKNSKSFFFFWIWGYKPPHTPNLFSSLPRLRPPCLAPHPLTLRCFSSLRRHGGWTRPPGVARRWMALWRTRRDSSGSAVSPPEGWYKTCIEPWRSYTGRSPSACAACCRASERWAEWMVVTIIVMAIILMKMPRWGQSILLLQVVFTSFGTCRHTDWSQ